MQSTLRAQAELQAQRKKLASSYKQLLESVALLPPPPVPHSLC